MQCLWSSDVGIRSSGSEVSCDCGLPLLGSGNWTEILWGLNPEQQPSLHLERTTSQASTKRLLEATLPCWTVHTQQLLSEDKIVIQAYHPSPLITLSCIFLSGLEAPFSVTLTLLSSLENEQTQPHQNELAASLVLTSSSGDNFVCVCNALARVRRSDIAPPSHSLPCSSSLNTAVSRRWCEGRGVWPWLQSLGSKWGQQSTWHPGPSVSRHRWWQIWSSLKMFRAYITV